jgi:hypothetical protein
MNGTACYLLHGFKLLQSSIPHWLSAHSSSWHGGRCERSSVVMLPPAQPLPQTTKWETNSLNQLLIDKYPSFPQNSFTVVQTKKLYTAKL